MQTEPRLSSVTLGRVVALALLAAAIYWLWSSLWPPSVSVTISAAKADHYRIHLDSNFRVNGLMSASLWAKGIENPLWLREFKGRQKTAEFDFHFGQPADGNQLPRRIEPAEVFCLLVQYQYDIAIPPTPCSGHQPFWFRLAADGTPEPLAAEGHPYSVFKEP